MVLEHGGSRTGFFPAYDTFGELRWFDLFRCVDHSVFRERSREAAFLKKAASPAYPDGALRISTGDWPKLFPTMDTFGEPHCSHCLDVRINVLFERGLGRGFSQKSRLPSVPPVPQKNAGR